MPVNTYTFQWIVLTVISETHILCNMYSCSDVHSAIKCIHQCHQGHIEFPRTRGHMHATCDHQKLYEYILWSVISAKIHMLSMRV